MIADCPGCKRKIAIFPEDGWSNCPRCDMLVRLDTSSATSLYIEAGLRENGQIVRSTHISRGYISRTVAPTSSSAPQPPRVLPVAAGTPTPTPGSSAPAYRSPARTSAQPTANRPVPRPAPPRLPDPASLDAGQVRAERARIAAEFAELGPRIESLRTELGQLTGDPARTSSLSATLSTAAQRQVLLISRDEALYARETELEERARRIAREQAAAASRQNSERGKYVFGFLTAFFVIALGVFGWQVGLTWDIKAVGLAILLSLAGGLLGWGVAAAAYS